ncbi:MAG: MBL fold metallo-hydrolase [Spirochaetales bacterium]|nr:MBL fold metallo-hydrolase [Spirochaetales bacterium]
MTKLRILGTGNAQAVECYNTCLTIENENGILLVDAGGGNGIFKILENENIELSSIHHIFVTHAHTDHIFGVLWLIRRIGETMNKGKMDGTLTIYTHKELAEFLIYVSKTILTKKVSSLIGERILFSVHEDGDERTIIGNKFTVFDIGSTKMKQFGFRMEYENGKVLVDPGDEPLLEQNYDKARNADWMTHEAFCTYEDRERFKPYEKHHSTALDAAKLAESLGVKNLILYHTEDKTLTTRKERYTKEAKEYFTGNVYVPDDRESFIL